MIPFTLPGPAFLAFYTVFAIVVLVVCTIRTRSYYGRGSEVSVSTLTADPYAIAYLRKGQDETIKVALFNLADRGILDVDDGSVSLKRKNASEALRRDLDRVLVSQGRESGKAAKLMSDAKVVAACHAYKKDLQSRGLLPDDREQGARLRMFFIAAALLVGVAAIKVLIALAQGRSNVGGLIFLTIVALIAALFACSSHRTVKGKRALESVQALLKRAKGNASRLRPGGASNEALLLASAFGLAVLPAAAFPVIEQMFPKPQSSGDSGSSGDGGSSCSSSCGGGGGCGGCGGD